MEQLLSENLCLRSFESRDAEQFAAAVRESANSVGKWLSWWKPDFSAADAESWFAICAGTIAARTGFGIGIFHKTDGRLIGSVGINRIDYPNRQGAMGYWVRESEQGAGFCTEAVLRMRDFGFDELKLARLEIVVLADNLASRKVAEKSGAKFECIIDQRLIHNGLASAAAVYSLV